MGTWGPAITSDDTVLDIINDMKDRLKAGDALAVATDWILSVYEELLDDADEGPLVWLGIAHIQWQYGLVDPSVQRKIAEDLHLQRGLDRWREEPPSLARRLAVLAAFTAKISTPNPKPSRMPKIVRRPAPYPAGACLSILTEDGRYAAAIVLAVDNKDIECGCNLVGVLDYLSASPATAEVFEQRAWLYKHHGNWRGAPDLLWHLPVGFKKESKRFTVIGQTPLRATDPVSATLYGSWRMIDQQVLHIDAMTSGAKMQ